jgi:hypothetical protein
VRHNAAPAPRKDKRYAEEVFEIPDSQRFVGREHDPEVSDFAMSDQL